MSLQKMARVVAAITFIISLIGESMGAAPTIQTPATGYNFGSHAPFDSTLQGSAQHAVTAGVWDVGSSAFLEQHDATIGGTAPMIGTVTINFNTAGNEWNITANPGMQSTTANIHQAIAGFTNLSEPTGACWRCRPLLVACS